MVRLPSVMVRSSSGLFSVLRTGPEGTSQVECSRIPRMLSVHCTPTGQCRGHMRMLEPRCECPRKNALQLVVSPGRIARTQTQLVLTRSVHAWLSEQTPPAVADETTSREQKTTRKLESKQSRTSCEKKCCLARVACFLSWPDHRLLHFLSQYAEVFFLFSIWK
jgi:hypothetical protein